MRVCVHGVHIYKLYLFLVVKVSDATVRMIVLFVIEWEEFSKVLPVTIILITHVITNTACMQQKHKHLLGSYTERLH